MNITSPRFGFHGGEVSDFYEERIDHTKYSASCKIFENCWATPEGAAVRRPGTKFIASAKYSDKKIRLVPFEFSTTQAYVLEFGDQYVRFYMNGGRIEDSGQPIEISTPYSEDELARLQFAQSADVLYIVHPNHPPARIARSSHTSWSYQTIDFKPPATEEQPWYPQTTITPGAVSGEGVTFTAGSAIFLAGDVGRRIVAGTAMAIITSYTSTTSVKADIVYSFPNTNPIAAGDWKIEGTPDGKLSLDTGGKNKIATVTCTLAAFRSSDVGKYIYVGTGTGKITAFVSTTKVKMRILQKVKNITNQANDNPTKFDGWSLEGPVWTDSLGYPGSVTIYDQRLILGGSPTYPTTIWGSVIGDYENFSRGDEEDNAFSFTLAAKDVQTISWIYPGKSLMVGTASGEWKFGASGVGDEPLSATNVLARLESSYGSESIEPVRVDTAVIFVQRGKKFVRELVYSFEGDSYVAPDLMRLARHLSTYQPNSIAWARNPEPILFLTTEQSDGPLLALSYSRPENVVAWSRWITDGKVLSVASIPSASDNAVYMAVRRTINSSAATYIEMLAPLFQDLSTSQGWIFCDSALTYSGGATGTLTGLNHLEGKTVKVWVNGHPHPDRAVSGGSITLQEQATSAVVGLPYTTRIQTLNLVPPQAVTSKGLSIRQYRLDIDLLAAFNLKLGNDFNRMESPLDSDTLYTESKSYILIPGGWTEAARLCLESSDNAPMILLGYNVRLQIQGTDGD